MSGIYEGTDLADKTFFGFRLDPATGNLDVEVINDGTSVALPQEGVIDPLDYRAWLWSRNTVQFEINGNGHLLMRML
jgi:hypothetical protein